MTKKKEEEQEQDRNGNRYDLKVKRKMEQTNIVSFSKSYIKKVYWKKSENIKVKTAESTKYRLCSNIV